MSRRGEVRIGTSGWIYRHWRGVFYRADLPVKRWFACYSEAFDTVEINNTFYRLPGPAVFDAWRRQAPRGFVYALKASRFLTHLKKLHDPEEPLANILDGARRLGPHLGPVLYQLPPHWHCNTDRLRAFLALLPEGFRHVFEFRDATWYNDDVRTLLTGAGAGFCIHDWRAAPSPLWVTGPLAYVRFHGSTDKAHAGRYHRAHLRRWAEHIQEFRRTGHDVYVYFNNDAAGNAVINARELQELVEVSPATSRRVLF